MGSCLLCEEHDCLQAIKSWLLRLHLGAWLFVADLLSKPCLQLHRVVRVALYSTKTLVQVGSTADAPLC